MSSKGEIFFVTPQTIESSLPTRRIDSWVRYFDLIAQKHIKPIVPMKILPFEDIPVAFRYMKGGSHIGKIVISNGSYVEIHVPVSYQTLFQIVHSSPTYRTVLHHQQSTHPLSAVLLLLSPPHNQSQKKASTAI